MKDCRFKHAILTPSTHLTRTHSANLTLSPIIPFTMAAGPDGFDYQIASLQTGTKKTIPIPGLSITIPVVGSAGIVIDLQLDGDLNELQVEIGLDACATTLVGQECGSALTSALPVWILNQTLSFSSICPSATK
jgi:hypothetical protein